MNFPKKLKEERLKHEMSQQQLGESLNISRQSISKWERGEGYPSIELLIRLSEVFEITIDELLKGDEHLKEKIIEDSKKLAYPKWKTFFDCVFLLGAFLLVVKLIVLGLNHFVGTNIIIPDGLPKIISNFLPLVLMIIGGSGSDILKNKYR